MKAVPGLFKYNLTSGASTVDRFILTQRQVFELVNSMRDGAAKDARRRRECSTSIVRAFHNGGYVSFDEAAMMLLDKAGLTLREYHAWRASK